MNKLRFLLVIVQFFCIVISVYFIVKTIQLQREVDRDLDKLYKKYNIEKP